MITLKQEVIDEIRADQQLRNLIQVALKISHTTLYKYLDNNDSKLANVNVLETLKLNSKFKTDKDILAKWKPER